MFPDETRPIILITCCAKYREYLAPAIKRLTHPDWRIIGLVGGAPTTVYDLSNGVLELSAPDNYESLPTKIHAAMEWIHTHFPSIPGVFKTDDDVIFDDLDHLKTIIYKKLNLDYWGNHVSKTDAGIISSWRIDNRFEDKTLRPAYQAATYCFGTAYWVSHNSLGYIAAAEKEFRSSFLEDVCVGFILNKQGIFPERIQLKMREIIPRSPVLLTYS